MGEHTGVDSSPRPPSQDAGQHVLVADPDPAGRSRVCAILRDNGILTQTADTAAEVLAATEAEALFLPALWEAGNFSWEVVFDDIALMDLEAAAQWRVETGVIAEPPDVRAAIDLSYLQAVDPSRVTLTL